MELGSLVASKGARLSKATTLSATCPSHLHAPAELLHLHAPAICFSGRSRLPFARPQAPPSASAGLQGNNSYSYYMPLPSVFQGVQDCRLPAIKPPNASNPPAGLQGNNSYSYMPLPSVFAGFKTAVCPASSPPHASNPPAGLQGNNSYSYMPLPSVFQGVQDCRLPGLKPSKRFRRPPRQQAFLTATTCPCHLLFRGFKTAVCPPSIPQNASNPPAGLQGNNSYSYMPLPSVFQGVQDCRLPALKPPKRFQPSSRPPRQQLLQLHAPAICFSGGSRLPFARPQTLQTLPQASKATTLTATCPCHLFFRGFKTAVCPPSNPPNASNPPAGLQGNNSHSYYMPLPSVFQGVQDCRLPALKPPKRFQPFRRPPRQQLLQLHAPAICFSGGSRLPFACPQSPQTLPQASKATTPAICFSGGSRLPFARPQTPQTLPTLPGNNSCSYMPLPSVFQGVQDCRLPALKPPKRFRRPPRQQLLQLHASAICFSGGSRLPFAHPQTPQTLPTLPQACKATTLTAKTLPQASKATTLTATCPCHLFFRGFKTAVCPASNPPNASAGLQGNNSYSYYMPLPSVFQGVQDCRLPAVKPPKRFQPSRRPPRQQLLQLHVPAICFSGGPTLPQASKATTLTATTCPCHLFFRGFKTAVCPPSNPPNASNPPAGLQGNNSYSYMSLPSVFQGVQDCRLPALKPPKRFCRPPRQQLLQLHAPAICFSGGSRLPFARPQTPQTLLQASKATTLTATCPCHLFFRGFKTAVCPPSIPPNTSNPSAGLQGNNSDS